MSVQLMESLTAVGFGAADAVVGAKVTRRLPGNISAQVALEGAGILFGLFGQKLGFGADVRDPVMISAMALAGSRGAKLAMQGKLFQPAQWGSVGGDGGYDGFAGGGGATSAAALQRGRNWAPNVRRLGRGGMGQADVYHAYPETGGVAS